MNLLEISCLWKPASIIVFVDPSLLCRLTQSLLRCSNQERAAATRCLLTLSRYNLAATTQAQISADDELTELVKKSGEENDVRDYTVVSTLLNYLLHEG